MLKTLSTCAAIVIFCVGFAQNPTTESKLDSITSEAQATEFLEYNKSLNSKFIVFSKEKHHSRLSEDLFGLGKGGKKVYESELEKTYYKLIETNKVLHHRISYIVLDGNKMAFEDIVKLRKNIISRYRQGRSFDILAKQYSMDINGKRGGDTGWFVKGDQLPEFENEAIYGHHGVGDVFTLDIPSRKLYYVMLKTHDNMLIDEIKVLKVVEPIAR